MCFIILVKFPAARNRFNQAYGSELYDRNSRKSFKNFDLVVTQLIGIERPCFSRKKAVMRKTSDGYQTCAYLNAISFKKCHFEKHLGIALPFQTITSAFYWLLGQQVIHNPSEVVNDIFPFGIFWKLKLDLVITQPTLEF